MKRPSRLAIVDHRKKPKKKITEPFILETKLIPSVLKEGTISRQRLLSRLKKNLNKKLILITADAGYGKTTFLLQFLKEEKLPHIFYTLDNNDAELTTFISHLSFALEKIQKDLCARTRNIITQIQNPAGDYEMVMGTLINELLQKRKEELFIILDDYHNIQEKSIVHKAMNYFIEHLPENIRVIISSRAVPQLASIARWRSKQDIIEITRNSLRFTDEEIKSLLNEIYQLTLHKEETKRLIEHTEGWITGIQLILQTAGKDGKTVKETLNGYLEANRPLFDYFAGEILAHEPPAVQEFLKKSSILYVITPEACNSIFGMKGSRELLRDLEKRNLFLSTISEKQYKYHRLFREFLLSQIKGEGFNKDLHLKAADYYQRKRQLERTIEHYLEAGSYEWAGKVIAQVAEEMMDRARFSTLQSWLKRVPAEILETQPGLLVIQGRLCLEQGLLEQAEAFNVRVESTLKQGLKGVSNSMALTNALLEHGRLLWAKGDYGEAIKFLRKALLTCPRPEAKKNAEIFNLMGILWAEQGDLKKAKFHLLKAKAIVKHLQDPYFRIRVEYNLTTLLGKQGEMKLAFGLEKPLVARVREHYTLGVGFLFANAARDALDVGQMEWAEQCLNQGMALCKSYHDPKSEAALHRGFGALYMEKTQWEQAQQHLERAKEEFARLGWIQMGPFLLRDLGCLYRYRGDLEMAQKYYEQALRIVTQRETPLKTGILIEMGFIEAFQGKFEKAEMSIKRALSLAQRFGWKREEFRALLAYSTVYSGKNKEKGAFRLFCHAIQLARLKGYDGILARELRHSPYLLELARNVAGPKSPPAKSGRAGFSYKKGAASKYLREILIKRLGISGAEKGEISLRVQLFGQFGLSMKGESKTSKLKRRTTKAILAYFLLHPQKGFTWEEIASWAWPDSPASVAHKMCKNTFSKIRTCAPELKQAILYRDGRYHLNSDLRVRVDVWEFFDLLSQASAETEEDKIGFFERAVVLYGGPLLPGFYQTWIDNLRNTLKYQYLQVLGLLSKRYATKGDYEKSVAYCLKYLGLDELDEEVHRLLISNYIQLGQKSKALKQYEKLRKVLRKEYKKEPSPETTSLLKSLR